MCFYFLFLFSLCIFLFTHCGSGLKYENKIRFASLCMTTSESIRQKTAETDLFPPFSAMPEQILMNNKEQGSITIFFYSFNYIGQLGT